MKVLGKAASISRQHMNSAYGANKTMPWPSNSEYPKSNMNSVPSLISDFLALVISGKNYTFSSSKTVRLSRSFAQDLCVAATQCKWKTYQTSTVCSNNQSLEWWGKVADNTKSI